MSNSQTTKLIIELDSREALDATIVGSKAASVAGLIAQGATVPSGFVIRAEAFSAFVKPTHAEIARLLSTVDVENPASAFEAADAIKELMGTLPIGVELVESLTTRVVDTPTGLAVRSSATAEDLEGASFAGMYDTFLDATDAESVLKRVRDVWASYYTGRAISYRQRQGISHEAGSMAVLVMQLINADAGGVVFTRDPRDGKEQILINAALGLGEGVVSGEAQADSFTLDPESFAITSRNVIDKEWMFVRGTSGSTGRVPVPAVKRSTPALADNQLVAIAEAATRIKNATGDDRDIEFAVADDRVHILQSRPVTTGAPKSTDFPVEWDSPEEEKLHWKGADKPALPLTIDFVFMSGIAQKRSVDTTGQYMGRNDLKKIVNGYVYSAESPRDPEEVKARLLKHHLQGRRYLENRTTLFDAEVKAELERNLTELADVRPAEDAPIPEHVSFLRQAMQVGAHHMNDLHWRCWGGFQPNKDDFGAFFAEVTGRSKGESAELLLGVDHMTARLTRRMIGMASLVKSDPWLKDKFESRDYSEIFARGSGQRSAVAKFRSRIRSMMKIWGCRNGIGYGSAWKPTDPTWDMKPEIPLDSIGSYVRQELSDSGRSPAELSKHREDAIRSVRKKIGRDKKLRKRFEFELFRATNHVKIMENHNYLIEQRTFGEYREAINRVGLALVNGGWIDTSDDIYYLRLAQLDGAVATGDYSHLRSLVIRAKEQFAADSLLERPESLGALAPEKDKDGEEDAPIRGLSEDGQTIHGEPSSEGSFTGVARVVITRTSTPPDVRKGEVLVTENTGPDWVPIFPLLGGLVLNGGDNFQHASLIAREYGVPCVIQTKEATAKIADGQMITVDGTAGTVMLNPVV